MQNTHFKPNKPSEQAHKSNWRHITTQCKKKNSLFTYDLKDHVGEWINSFVLLPRPTSSELDRVSWIQSLKTDHEAFWSGCIKPSQLDYLFFTKSVNGLKIILDSWMTGKPQHHSSSWITDAGWCSSRKVADKCRKGWLENGRAERSTRRKQKNVHLLHEPAMHCCSDGARVRAVTVFRVRPGDITE